ncbi:N-acetylmuramoyl-L-alanine amidase [Paenibacillus sp. N3.4]|nr:N-acetylmuramoyl-L-alanine amidase [Paenibacillus sp. N3.4]TXK84050.1 N-acetylmuramoyl-L-alanine amidase [Paenibacillus sp. N3.4]
MISADDANKIIAFLSAAYFATTDPQARAEFNRLANELRKASDQPVE